MAEREALRDFQRRLADRLQAAPARGGQAAWLAVEAAGGRYLIALTQAGEIFPAVEPLVVPHTQPWFLGVASLRGDLYGVVDLAGLLTDNPEGLPRPRVSGREAQLVTLHPALGVPCALRVDRLAGLRSPEHLPAATSPDGGVHAPALGLLHHEACGRSWRVIDLQVLSQQPRVLPIAA